MRSFLSGIPPRLCKTLFTFMQPLLINTTISYVADASADISYGRALIGAWTLVFFGVACSTALTSYQTTRFIIRLKGGLLGLIYQETMKARACDLGETTAVALIGTDVERIGQNFLLIHELWASIIEIALATWLLEQQVFLACLAPVVVILISIGITVPMSNLSKKAQVAWIERIQDRLRVTSNMIDDMKAVKMLGLSPIISDTIQRLRRIEIQTSKVYRKILVWNVLLSECPQNISPVAMFAVYVLIALYSGNVSLLTAQAFTAIALINLLTIPVIQLVQVMPQFLQCVGSFERIQDYCNYADGSAGNDESGKSLGSDGGESHDSHSVAPAVPDLKEKCPTHAITLSKNDFSWKKSEAPFLQDVNLRVPVGSVTVCVGAVASGKSMLLESILGETLRRVGPKPDCSSSIAYCAQEPWLENGTIQSNILGVSQCDSKWYQTVKLACGLDADLQALQRGDQTVVGSKGLNLSGGQKQRIALARAVYSRKDIIILDDVFSGMDAHTVDLVSRRLLGGDGLFRKHGITVILATHSHKLLGFADTIFAIVDGRISETGNLQTLLANEGYVSKLGLKLRHETSSEEQAEDAEILQQEHNVISSTEPLPSTAVTDKAFEASRKNGDWSVYRYYIASSGYKVTMMFLISMATWVFCTEFATIWLDWWSEVNENDTKSTLGWYMGWYTFFGLFGVVAIGISCWIGIINMISNSAIALHSDMLISTVRAPLRFFTTTNTGTLTNRFSQDMELIDMNLPLVMINYCASGFTAIAKAIILIVFSQYLATMAPFVVAVLYFLQSFYLKTSRQVRFLEIEGKAPLYTHFIESVAGAPTIRAFGWQSQYQERNYKFIDQSQRPAYIQYCIQGWLNFVLDILVTIIAAVLVAVVVSWKAKFSAGNVGVSLIMVMTFSAALTRLIKVWTMMESSIGAVARIKQFVADTESEETSLHKVELAQNWPMQGNINITSLIAAHSLKAEPVIKGVSFSIRPSEHVALCGRSGSGKTSIILALLQMMEIRGGQITIDGVDVSTISCNDIRSHLNVVPQDPLLMPGTIRFNIDPFGNASDEDIVRALERVRLWSMISEQGGLGKEMDTAMWSAGQKQLLCLARALVRNSKILILDEATSSVDSETASVMQEIIDTDFSDCTVLAVMHHLTYITRYDQVALLDNGHLMEFGPPETLLSQQSRFASLYAASSAHP
ncbi:hypothetical protein E8E14_000617 [Neopestalotiopsis sp. 37M]|nr:hypothetical protein E8E14_000617 [Neopestalotiopsis sp. 37M]